MNSPHSHAKQAKRITLRDVAKMAGVSAQTVSCVVNGTGSISDDVREKVTSFAASMGYTPNQTARTMRTGQSAIIGVIVDDMRKPFFPGLVKAIEKNAAKNGNVILLIDIHGSPIGLDQRLASLRKHGVDGILTTHHSEAIGDLGLPTVVIGGPVPECDCVHADDKAGGSAIAKLLLRTGHRSIGLLSSDATGCIADRRSALISELTDKADIVWNSFVTSTGEITQAGRRLIREQSVTAIACSTDEIAVEVMHFLLDEGIRVPEDVSVVGFDDIPWANVIRPALTTVEQPTEALARSALKFLAERMREPKRTVRHLALPVRLVERQTVKDMSSP